MTDVLSWTKRDEAKACCEHSPGPVQNLEHVARLLHSGIAEPNYEPFRRSELYPTKRGFTNDCGDSDGTSIVRCGALTHADLRDRATKQAARKDGRYPCGALIASVEVLRRLRRPGQISQIAYLYDDPLSDELFHAVVRGCQEIPKAAQDEARILIKRAFSEHVPQATPVTNSI